MKQYYSCILFPLVATSECNVSHSNRVNLFGIQCGKLIGFAAYCNIWVQYASECIWVAYRQMICVLHVSGTSNTFDHVVELGQHLPKSGINLEWLHAWTYCNVRLNVLTSSTQLTWFDFTTKISPPTSQMYTLAWLWCDVMARRSITNGEGYR